MKIILTKDVDRVGNAGEIVQVADGFARNFLIPQRQALIATDSNVARFESRRKRHQAAAEKARRRNATLAQDLEKDSLTAVVHVGEEDRLFGSVTAQHIADLLVEKGYEIDRRQVLLEEPIRSLGVFNISIRLQAEVTATVKLWVVKE